MGVQLNLIIFALSLCSLAAKDLDIYLLIGQSNMAGRAPYSLSEAEPITGVELLNASDIWEPAANPLNRHSSIRKGLGSQKMNLGYAFSLAMRDSAPDRKIGLVVNAKGGSSIQQWTKGDRFYNEAIRRTKIAQQSGKLTGILWHQGESDANDPKYLTKIIQLITNLRQDLDAPEAPFIAGQINPSGDYLFNQLILELPDLVPNTEVVSNEGLTAMDKWHFDHDSMLILGQRYAVKMQELQAAD
ncbi:sialate O-acetylesterase [Coraliomargarita sp. W4R53]